MAFLYPFQYDVSSVAGSGTPSTLVVSDNDRTVAQSGSSSSYLTVHATADAGKSSGKWYWETINRDGAASAPHMGVGIIVSGSDTGNYIGHNTNGYSVFADGQKYYNSVASSSGVSAWKTAGSRLYHKLDMDAGTYEVAGPDEVFATIATGLTGSWMPAVSVAGGTKSEICLTLAHTNGIGGSIPAGFQPFDERIVYPTPLDEDHANGQTYSNHGRTITTSLGGFNSSRTATTVIDADDCLAKTTGKWYWETRVRSTYKGVANTEAVVGIIKSDTNITDYPGRVATSVGNFQRGQYFWSNGSKGNQPGTTTQIRSAYSVVRHSLDMDAGTYSIANEDSAWKTIFTNISAGESWMPVICGSDTSIVELNISEDTFIYQPEFGEVRYDLHGETLAAPEPEIPYDWAINTSNVLGNGDAADLVFSNNSRWMRADTIAGFHIVLEATAGLGKSK